MKTEVIGKQPALGVGKPDFSKGVSGAIERPGIYLKENQSLRLNALVFSNIPSPYAWVLAPLAPGDTQHVIDRATGLALPFTVPIGYTYSLIQRTATGSEDIRLDSYVDGEPGVADDTSTVNFLDDSSKSWPINAFVNYIIEITGGTGEGQRRKISANTATRITVAIAFDTAPDSTSTYIIEFLVMSAQVGGGDLFFKQEILGLSTKMLDPTASSSHVVDDIITNLGAGNYEGGIADIILYEAIGTPSLPQTKTVKCKWCGYMEEVAVNTTRLECPKCHKLTIYYTLEKFKGSK